MLSPADVKRYQDQGYLVVPDVLDAATLAAIRVELARILDGARAVTTHTDRLRSRAGPSPGRSARAAHQDSRIASIRSSPSSCGTRGSSRC